MMHKTYENTYYLTNLNRIAYRWEKNHMKRIPHLKSSGTFQFNQLLNRMVKNQVLSKHREMLILPFLASGNVNDKTIKETVGYFMTKLKTATHYTPKF